MYEMILKYLCCPKCGCDFAVKAEKELFGEVIDGELLCDKGHAFRISEGVADFSSEEQAFANQWESMSQEQNFEKLDREMDASSSRTTLEHRKMVLKAIVDTASEYAETVILDVASGRGLLLTELAKALPENVHIISADLSAFVLRYDRKKFKKLAPNRKISYLACDATKLPLKDSAVDAATSYEGFSNMLGCAGEGIKEAHRVLKPGGALVNSFVVINEVSRGFEVLKQVCEEHGLPGAEKFFLSESVEKEHSKQFAKVDVNTVCEGIGEDNGMDLLPYDGEWYAEQVFCSKK